MAQYKLLGSFTIEENGQPSELLKSDKGCALLAYLIVMGETQPREKVADLVWDAESTRKALQNLRQLLSSVLRGKVAELQIERKRLTFTAVTETFVDLYQMEEAFVSRNLEQIDAGLRLYKGDLLADFYLHDAPRFNEWLLVAREQLRQRVWDRFHQVCLGYETRRLWPQGIDLIRHWLTLDNLDEVIHRRLMRFLAADGQVDAALQQYASCQQIIRDELGIEPEKATTNLAAQIEQMIRPAAGNLPAPGALPPNAYLPFHRNAAFTGRSDELKQVAKLLLPPQGVEHRLPQTAVISGIGGLGKSQLAVEYAYRYGRFYPGGVFWLSFADAENVIEEVAFIGGERGMKLYQQSDKLTQSQQIAKVQNAWQESEARLLIFDNCEDELLLTEWLPVTGGCSVLVTSRRGAWPLEMPLAELPLSTLSSSASVAFLQGMVRRLSAQDAAEIAAELGSLPLALQMAGHYLQRHKQVQPSDYLTQLEAAALLHHDSLQGKFSRYSPTGHELHVAQTFYLSFQRLDVADPVDEMARKLLARTAVFTPGNPIPKALLLSAVLRASPVPLGLKRLAEAGLRRLVGIGFLTVGADETIMIHRLVAAFVENVLENDVDHQPAQKDVEAAVIDTLTAYKQEGDQYFIRLPFAAVHLRSITRKALVKEDLQSGRLAALWGSHLFTSSEYDRARPYLEHALRVRQQLLEPTDPEVLESLTHIGWLLYRLGKFDEAAPIFEQILAIRELQPEPNLAELAIALRDLGALYWRLTEHDKALAYHERELALRRQHFGSTHPLVAQSLNTIGSIYGSMGQYNQARFFQEQSLEIYEQSEDQEESVGARLLSNLATTYNLLGDYATARKHAERAFQIRQRIFSENHYYMASSMLTLGSILTNLGEFEAARPYFEKSLSTLEERLGRQHLQMVRGMIHWGNWLFRTGDRQAAQMVLLEALEIQKMLKPVHGQTALVSSLLGELYMEQEEMTTARPFLDRALEIWSQVHKEESLDRARSLMLLGRWHQAKQNNRLAMENFEKARTIYKKNLPIDHPDIQRVEQSVTDLAKDMVV